MARAMDLDPTAAPSRASQEPAAPLASTVEETRTADGDGDRDGDGRGPRDRRDASLPPGTTLHRYVVLSKLGEGGMGVVYAAYDHGLDRKVALKVLREPHSDSGRRRLLREAQALAQLNHPAVVTVHDVGTFRDQVFVAMEYVDGTTLRGWLADADRSWREVLDMFRRSGEGLVAAHEAGLVHRDFKPENVLIDQGGAVRVSDFGLVATTGGGDGDSDGGDGEDREPPPGSSPPVTPTRLTRTGAALGTPAYMAPEQWAGDPAAIDTRADQFSFCVALYEALFGVLPFAGAAAEERCGEIAAARLTPPVQGREVPAWLKRAVVKGLAYAPADRHASMEALVRLLGGPSRRTRRRAIAAGAVTLVAGAALVIGFLGRGAASSAPPLCRGARRMMDPVWGPARRAALETAFRKAGPAEAGPSARVVGALDHWSDGWVAMRTEACEATRLRGEQSGAMLDARMACLDDRLAELRALTDLLARPDRKILVRALDAVRGLTPLDGCADLRSLGNQVPAPGAGQAADVARLRQELGRVRALLLTGRYADGLSGAKKLVKDAHQLGYRPIEARALLTLGALERATGDMAGAVDTLYRAVAAGEAGRTDGVTADAWLHLMWVEGEERAHYDQALRLAKVARGALDRLSKPGRLEAVYEDWLGVILLDENRLDEARPHLERAVELHQKAKDDEDTNMAPALQHLGILHEEQGDYATALRYYRRARVMTEKERGPDHPDVLVYLGSEGSALYAAGRFDEALPVFKRVLALAMKSQGPRSPMVASTLNNLALCHWQKGELARAQSELERALALNRRIYGDRHPRLINLMVNMGHVLREQHQLAVAIERYQQAAALATELGGSQKPKVADALEGLGLAYLESHHADRAVDELERALTIREDPSVPVGDRGEVRFQLARALRAAGREPARARRLALTAKGELEKAGNKDGAAEVTAWLATGHAGAGAPVENGGAP